MTEAKVILITGAAKRIGAEIARVFHRHGYRIIIHYHRSSDEAESLAQQLNTKRPNSAATLAANLTDSSQIKPLAANAESTFGRIDVLLNNASSFFPTDFGNTSETAWEELLGSNLRGAFFLSEALSPTLQKHRGCIINIVDTHADQPLAGYAVYSIAKAGLKAMTKSLAKELAPAVRVNGISPGAILWPPALADDNDPAVADKRKSVLKTIPLGKLGQSNDIAETALFLAEKALYVTGQVIKVDGGRSLF